MTNNQALEWLDSFYQSHIHLELCLCISCDDDAAGTGWDNIGFVYPEMFRGE